MFIIKPPCNSFAHLGAQLFQRDLLNSRGKAGVHHQAARLALAQAAGTQVVEFALIQTSHTGGVLALYFLLTAQDQRGGTVASRGAEHQHVLALVAHTALGAATEIHCTAQDLVGIPGQDTGGVHLAQGIFADLDGDIVVIQHVIVASEVDGVQVVLALVVVLQRTGAADGNLAAQLDAHLLHPGTGGLLDGNSAPAAGVVAQQLHLYQFHVGALGGVDAHERSGHAVLGIAAQHLHDGQAAALGGVDGQAAQRAGVGLVQLYLKDGGRLDGSALAHGEMLFHVGVGG